MYKDGLITNVSQGFGVIKIKGLLDFFKNDELFSKLNHKNVDKLITGISESQRSIFVSSMYKYYNDKILLLTQDNYEGEKLYSDLSNWLNKDELFFYPGHSVLPFEMLGHSKEVERERAKFFYTLFSDKPFVLVIPVKAFCEKLPPFKIAERNIIKMVKNDIVDLEDLLKRFVNLGYERVQMVEAPGQFSHRGGIIDVFSMAEEKPLRIELFDDEIESLRFFDVKSQRSKEEIEEFLVPPKNYLVLEKSLMDKGINNIKSELDTVLGRLYKKDKGISADNIKDRVHQEIEFLQEGVYISGSQRFVNYFYEHQDNFLDYLPGDTLIWLDEPNRLKESYQFLENQIKEVSSSLLQEGKILPSESDLFYSFEEILDSGKQSFVYSQALKRDVPFKKTPGYVDSLSAKSMTSFQGKWDLFIGELKQWIKENHIIFLLAPNVERGKNLVESLKEEDLPAFFAPDFQEVNLSTGDISVGVGHLSSGFIDSQKKIALVTYQDIFGEKKKTKLKKQKSREDTVKLSDYRELKVGDYVVHEQHGIGKYLGVSTLEVNGLFKDYLHIKYAGNDKLYIPTDQIHEVEKYVGGEGKKPKLSSLGGSEWTKIKKKVKKSVQELAKELLDLYAKRNAQKGFSFSPDTPWQKEFEDYFPYELTPDQQKAIEAVKSDMEKGKVMDRLLCGDVGYGKTEVAMRAAFKAIMDGKQVAMLVPTTILTQQHYQTFTERFAPFPVDIRALSRFSTSSEEKEIMEGIKNGKIDVIIGTHKLLSERVKFKDLGLLIIDEEQRFGVKHKEKIKMLKKNVDVLTMTATPIPRTLHMSLVNVRDLSVIETPPEGRFPVQTYVMEYSPQLIREAIRRELSREGQVYIVYNRVQGINKIAKEIHDLVPEASVGVAHGQMPERKLEKVMLDFLEESYNVLVSTSIVEAGLDIQNVNTIIIFDADKMGLSQLYQLRGRVGRSNKMAYAYLTYRKDKILTKEAEKRLQAIKEFTELGSGFKLALRDLEIRGAGNILGSEQHGFIMAVGFDMYCKMLEEAVKDLKGESTEDSKEREEELLPKVELNLNAYLPFDYIPDHGQKIEIYQKISRITHLKEKEDLLDELKDRFGPPPEPVLTLLDVTAIKTKAKDAGISSIKEEKNEIILEFSSMEGVKGQDLLEMTEEFKNRVTVSYSDTLLLKINKKNMKDQRIIKIIDKLLTSLTNLRKDKVNIYK